MKQLIQEAKEWGDSKGIAKTTNASQIAQFNYVHKELTEAQDALQVFNEAKENWPAVEDWKGGEEEFYFKDELGDILVTLINYACTRSEFESLQMSWDRFIEFYSSRTWEGETPPKHYFLLKFRVSLVFGQSADELFLSFLVAVSRMGYDPKECLQIAYDKIKDRTGATLNGEFVKD